MFYFMAYTREDFEKDLEALTKKAKENGLFELPEQEKKEREAIESEIQQTTEKISNYLLEDETTQKNIAQLKEYGIEVKFSTKGCKYSNNTFFFFVPNDDPQKLNLNEKQQIAQNISTATTWHRLYLRTQDMLNNHWLTKANIGNTFKQLFAYMAVRYDENRTNAKLFYIDDVKELMLMSGLFMCEMYEDISTDSDI